MKRNLSQKQQKISRTDIQNYIVEEYAEHPFLFIMMPKILRILKQ
jgi:hypothetical protein